MKTRTLFAVLLVSGICAVAQAGDIYKWVDAKGRFHYSDLPQPGWTRVDDKPGTARAGGGSDSIGGDEESQQSAVSRAADCARKEEQLKTYRSATRIVERDALGREKEYSDEDRDKLIAQTERDIASGCKAPALQ